MGTSKDYDGSPKWQGVKTAVTAAGADLITTDKASNLLASFVQQLVDLGIGGGFDAPSSVDGQGVGGPVAVPPPDGVTPILPDTKAIDLKAKVAIKSPGPVARGRKAGRGGGGASSATTRGPTPRSAGGVRKTGVVAQSTAQNVARFFSEVAKVGPRKALENFGLKNLDNMSPQEVALRLGDFLGGNADYVEETAVRDALTALVQEMAENAKTLDDLGKKFVEEAKSIEFILERFIGNYIFEIFCSTTYKGILETHGPEIAETLVGQIRDVIDMKVAKIRSERDFVDIDWLGDEGAKIVDGIVKSTVKIFLKAPQ